MKSTKVQFRLLIALFVLVLAACGTAPATEEATDSLESATTEEAVSSDTVLTLATTTSTYDSGLLDYIVPNFEEATGIAVEIVAVGTGAALELGENGDADVVLVHSRPREDAFVEAGHGLARYDVMYNDFVIVGPAEDPAGISDLGDVTAALTAIAEMESPFISRGDDSGTHSKELSLWEAAGIEPDGDWYQEAGQGMGAVLTIASEQAAYTISDRATYLARAAEGIELDVLFEGDDVLFNPYGIMPVNPDKNDSINAPGAQAFVEWLISVETQELIASFEVNETQLFFPDSDAYNASLDS
jgi:tungstate transport system substrate-binding protein